MHCLQAGTKTRGETIDSCCSDDLVTVLEIKVEKKPFKVTDRVRLFRKGIMAASLGELRMKGEQLRMICKVL